MAAIGDNLAARVTAVLLGSFLALALLVATVMLWPSGKVGGEGLFQLPVPEETASIVRAIEASPPAVRPLVLEALDTSSASVHLEPEFPPVSSGMRRAGELEWMFARYSSVLADRSFRVDIQPGLLPKFLIANDRNGIHASVRLIVQLKSGGVLVIERRPPAFIRSYIGRAAVILSGAVLVLLVGLTLAVRQTARPVSQMAEAARRFSLQNQPQALALSGPRELRDLAQAFNEMQERIRRLVEDRTRVLAAVAHDMRTYLTRMRLRTEFIEDADQRRRAETDVDEMSLLLDDTLLFAQQASRGPPSVEACDLLAEVAALVELRQELGERVDLAEPAGCVPSVACSRLALRRMLGNLIDNAIRYGGEARVSFLAEGASITICVDDDGPGVPPEALDRLMLPFERLETSRARATGGAGLGLAIVKGLAESCGASLAIENRLKGGFRATITFSRPSARA